MRKELGLLNFICLLAGLGFLVLAVVSVISSGDFLTIDNLFIISVSLLMALLFVVCPLLYLKSEGKLPLPGMKRSPSLPATPGGGPAPLRAAATSTPPLLDAKGRAVPPDVKAIMNRMGPTEAKDA